MLGFGIDLFSGAPSAGPERAKAEAMAAPPDVWRIAVLAIALGLEHRIDGAADGGHSDTRNGGLDAFVHGAHNQRILARELVRRLADHDGAANLRELTLK